jgi:hypothetical protein
LHHALGLKATNILKNEKIKLICCRCAFLQEAKWMYTCIAVFPFLHNSSELTFLTLRLLYQTTNGHVSLLPGVAQYVMLREISQNVILMENLIGTIRKG